MQVASFKFQVAGCKLLGLFGVMLLTREAVYLFGSDSLSWGVMLVFTLLVVWGWVVTLPSVVP